MLWYFYVLGLFALQTRYFFSVQGQPPLLSWHAGLNVAGIT